MREAEIRALEGAIDRVLETRELLKPHGLSQSILLLDILLLDLGQQLAKRITQEDDA